jgi:alpha-1,6-mannosyltransferase
MSSLSALQVKMQGLREGHPVLTNGVLAVTGLALLCLTRQFVSEQDRFTIGFSGCSGLSATLYLFAAAVVLTQPLNRWSMRIVIAVAVASAAVAYFAAPTSTDLYRYSWDGMVQHHGINPFRYVPGDRALTDLRDPYSDLYDNINRRDYARTIYPPGAQVVYWLITWISTDMPAMKLGMIAFAVLTAWALVQILKRLGRRPEEVLLFVWSPLWWWEVAGSGHVDAAVIAFVVLALLCRLRNDRWLTGLFLGLAIMTKFYPFVLFPALWTRRDWRVPAAIAGVAAVGYAMYSSVGKLVFGFLGEYQKEEGIDTGTRFFALDWAHQLPGGAGVPKAAFYGLAVVVMGAIAWWSWKHATVEVVPAHAGRRLSAPAFLKAAGALALAMMLLFSPHYPWYVLWLVPLYTLTLDLPTVTYVTAVFYGFTTYLADPGPKFFRLNEYIYSAVLIAFVVAWTLRRWRVLEWFVSRKRLDYGGV